MTEKCPEGQEWDPRLKKCVMCPGGKIRSKGEGRGLGRGAGKGPIGKPAGVAFEIIDKSSI